MNNNLEQNIKDSQNFKTFDKNQEWDKFVQSSGFKDQATTIERKLTPTYKSQSPWRSIAVAASFLLLLSIGSFWYLNQESIPDIIAVESGATNEIVELADGSTIVLEPNSSIKFPPSFDGKEERRVILQGSATFDIADDLNLPFVVVKDGVAVRVVGTIFEVKSRADNSIELETIEGTIKFYEIENEDTGFILNEGDRMSYKDGVFEELPSRNATEMSTLQILEYLMNKYDGKIYPKAYMPMDDNVTISINLDQSINELMNSLDSKLDFEYRSLSCDECYEITKMVSK